MRGAGAAAPDREPAGVAYQGHGAARFRREPVAAGRPYRAQGCQSIRRHPLIDPTNWVVDGVKCLQDIGVEPFLLSSTLLGGISQRLVRKLRPHCE